MADRLHHQFKQIPIPEGELRVERVCLHCGAKMFFYKSGSTSYVLDGGKLTSKPTKCKIVKMTVDKEVDLKSTLTELLVFLRFATDELPEGRTKRMCNWWLSSKGYKDVKKAIQAI